MSKVLIDRELLSVASLHLEYSGYTETGKKLRALLDTPSGTPAMPVKAYYYESGNLDGIRTRSVGLEVRKAFIDAPLVLEADALTQIACLEGEIAKRDEELAACRVAVENCDLFRARIAELEDLVLSLQCKAIESDDLRAELSAIKAHGVVMPEGWIPLTIEHEPGYPEDVAFGPKRMMDRLKKWLDRYFEMRLNAAPAAAAADAGLVDPAAWLWVWLMTYCKSRGLAPATQGHLFESVSDMRAVLAASRANGVPSAKS